MSEPLFSGLKVVDVSSVIAAPVAAMMLGDFGASVIKVEPPDGDFLRALSDIPTTPDAGNDYFWHMDGRHKRSLVLNLKHPRGSEILRQLIADCDVFITNQPFPVRRSLKLEYEDIKPLNPKMIYASLTAYGEAGPERDAKGFDLVAYWARSGLMDLVRDDAGHPAQALPGMGDHPTGVALYAAIVTALLRRERTGEGGLVSTSLLANGLWSAASVAGGAFAGGDMAAFRQRTRHPSPFGAIYQTNDNRYLQFSMVRAPGEILALFQALGLEALLEDPRFNTLESRQVHREVLVSLLRERIGQHSSNHWVDVMAKSGVPINRVQRMEEVISDAQIMANDMVIRPAGADHPVPLIIDHPVRVDSVPGAGAARAADLDEHSDEILAELGLSPAEILALRADGAVGPPNME
jgi:crotonobetainyl-CoA:carnitine CoA-transferase CaiB-like acyl-CoA transferase